MSPSCGKYISVRTGHHKSEVRHSQHSLTAHPSSPDLIHSQVHRIPWFLLTVSGTAPSGPGGWNGWGGSIRTAAATMCGNYGRQAIIRKTCSNQIVAKIFYVNYLIKWQKEKPLNSQGFYQRHWPDSNRRPTHYECVALPTALQWHPNSNCHSFDATRLLPKQQPCHHDLTGNRTRVYAVRGRRLSRLTIRPKGKSRRRDSNTRPLRPERSALPN